MKTKELVILYGSMIMSNIYNQHGDIFNAWFWIIIASIMFIPFIYRSFKK